MSKFGRSYSLEIGTGQPDEVITVEPPFTVEFDITRDYYASANTAQIRIYNLSEKTRNKIRKDVSTYDNFRSIVFKAGYGTNLPIVLKGNITQAWSQREGVDSITTIQCFDAGFAFVNGNTEQQFISGTPQKQIITDLVKSLGTYDVKVGAIGDIKGNITRGNTYSGNTTNILKELTGGGFFIDNGVAHVIGDDEYIEGDTLVISPASGLLGTPLLEQTIVHVDMLFESRIKLCQRVQLQSLTGSRGSALGANELTQKDLKDGFYRVISIHHRGMISESICGDAVTNLGLDSGAFTPVAQVANE